MEDVQTIEGRKDVYRKSINHKSEFRCREFGGTFLIQTYGSGEKE